MKKALAYSAAAVALSLGTLVAGAATSSAATQAISQGRIQLCSNGNYASAFQFQGDAFLGYQTNWIPAGSCQTFDVPGDAYHTTYVYVVGKWNTSNSQFAVNGPYQITTNTAAPGRKIGAVGRTDDHSYRWTEYANV
ncbi:hypothetical protein ACH4A8_29495 [Streptomyces vietnamensis]|uniref:hypothetical protein n=1 Tax=Streptomyces vietnamensis TaxID=362257 RepID=UPI003799937C